MFDYLPAPWILSVEFGPNLALLDTYTIAGPSGVAPCPSPVFLFIMPFGACSGRPDGSLPGFLVIFAKYVAFSTMYFVTFT